MKDKTISITIISIFLSHFSYAQSSSQDSTLYKQDKLYKSLTIPTILIGYGLIGIESDGIQSINLEIREEVDEHIKKKTSIDDFTQYVPIVSVYGLNAFGIKGKNNFKERSIILLTASLIMSTTVFGVKELTKIERPDGSTSNSFPSGHTANAFMGAEFLWQEYKDVSIWYGVSGYIVAAGTGIFRVYNNRHWLSDVVAGAGVGILSTKIAYLLVPKMKKNNWKKKSQVTGTLMPYYNGISYGIGMNLSIK
ncbi:phosphatase PAP2 family protein [Flammeovirgaceae bacterium SG7u.111]|nr:phosphatase PAP2 family protein [Flammeovirgaceae bacterium SG7u.132]WPO33376.1 phosphatase PAP2 family protein [Flammeovirgaceae bacterium SG7u.111]